MREFQWLFNDGLAQHVKTPLLLLTAVVVLMICAAAVLVVRARKQQRAAAAQTQPLSTDATAETPPETPLC